MQLTTSVTIMPVAIQPAIYLLTDTHNALVTGLRRLRSDTDTGEGLTEREQGKAVTTLPTRYRSLPIPLTAAVCAQVQSTAKGGGGVEDVGGERRKESVGDDWGGGWR